ncbi:family 16 glycoside hydrolase, partial [Ligaoa zhengdingensis]
MKKTKESRVLSALLAFTMAMGMWTVPAYAAAQTTAELDKTVFTDDFSDDTIGVNWEKFGMNQSDWAVADGVCTSLADSYPAGVGQKLALNGLTAQNCEFEADITLNNGSDAGILFRASDIADKGDGFTGYYAYISPNGSVALGHADQAWGGNLASVPKGIVQGKSYRLKVSAMGNSIQIYLDGEEVISLEDDKYQSGGFGLRSHCASASYDNIKITAYTDKREFSDDFSEDTIGVNWEKFGMNQSDWAIADGVCTSLTAGYPGGVGQKLALKDFNAQNCEMETDIKLNSAGDAGILFRTTGIVDKGDGFTGYYAYIKSNGDVALGHANQAWLGNLASVPKGIAQGETYKLKVSAVGTLIKVFLNGEEVISLEDDKYPSGGFGLRSHCTSASYDNVKIAAYASKEVSKIEVTSLPNKTLYFVGDLINTSGLQVTATYIDGSTRAIPASALEISFDSSTAGDEIPVVVSYEGKETSFNVRVVEGLSFPYHDDFSDAALFQNNWAQYGGGSSGWLLEDGMCKTASSSAPGQKLELIGGLTVSDFMLETDIAYLGGGGVDAGVIFRAADVTDRGDGYRGYYAYLANGAVGLGRCDNAWDSAFKKEVAANVKVGDVYRMKIACRGNNIKIYLDGELMLDVNDSKFSSGSVGFRAHYALAAYDNFVVSNDPDYVDTTVYKNLLQKLYDDNKDLDISIYPEDRWERFNDALEAARLVLENPDATQAQVNEAKSELAAAVSYLAEDDPVSAPHHLNPLLPGYGADPTIQKFGDTYYIYANTTDRDWCDTPMVFWSKDLVNWEGHALKLLVDEESYGGEYTHRMQWAPTIIEWKGIYYLYYTVYDNRPGLADDERENNIVAVSDNPVGPFTIKKCITYGEPGSASPENSTHDPHVFYDPQTDKVYLLYGGIYEKLFIEELNSDDLTQVVPGTRKALLYGSLGGNGGYAPGKDVTVGGGHQNFAEGPFVYTRELDDGNGGTFTRYYMTYSCENYSDASYKLRYAYSDDGIMGPYHYLPDPTEYFSDTPSNMIIRTSPNKTTDGYFMAKGPGHHSVLQMEIDGELQDYLVYHKLASESGTGRVHRQVCIDRIYYTEDGFIKEVRPTHNADGVDAIRGVERRARLTDADTVVTASSVSNNASYPFREPKYALDDNYSTMWQAAGAPKASDPDSAEYLQVDLGAVKTVTGFKSDFWLPHRLHKYQIEYSLDGETWEMYADRTDNEEVGIMFDEGKSVQARFVKITITDMQRYYDDAEDAHMKTGLWEFNIYGESGEIPSDVDKAALKELVEAIDGKYEESEYTAESWAELEKALEEAKAVIAKADA